MNELLSQWIIGIYAGAALCSACVTILGKNRSGTVKFVCGLIMLYLIAAPLFGLGGDYENLLPDESLYASAENYAAEAEKTRRSLESSVIEDSTCEYILSKAKELGVGGARAEVTLNETDAGAYPYELKLWGEGPEEAKISLTKWIESELGIPTERQYWSDEND